MIQKNILHSDRRTYDAQEVLRKLLNKYSEKFEYVKQEGEKDKAKKKKKNASSLQGKTSAKVPPALPKRMHTRSSKDENEEEPPNETIA